MPSPSRWHGRQTESSLGEPQDRLQRECRKRAVEDCASAAVATAAAGIGCTAQGETRAKAQSKSSGNLKNKITSTIKHKHGRPCVLFEGAFIFTQRVESGSRGTVLDLGSRRRIEHPSGSFSFLFFKSITSCSKSNAVSFDYLFIVGLNQLFNVPFENVDYVYELLQRP